MLSVVFLTMITSFAAMIYFRGASKVKNNHATMRFIAIHLANEQFAEVESLAFRGALDNGNLDFLGEEDNRKNFGIFDPKKFDEGKISPVEFEVTTEVENYKTNLKKVSVKVEWIEGGKKYNVEFEKIVRVN